MSKIRRAEYLRYRNLAKNSDQVFNIFLLEDGEGYSCVSEYGRRGTSLVRVVLCSNRTAETAASVFRRKLDSKRKHRETPYENDPDGSRNSPLAIEHGLSERFDRTHQESSINVECSSESTVRIRLPETSGILNKEQFESLEI